MKTIRVLKTTSYRLKGLLLLGALVLGWLLAIFPGVGRDQSNIPILITGTLLMLLTSPFLLAYRRIVTMKKIRVLLLMTLAWLALPASVSAFYNPSTGRWFSRDPIGESGASSFPAATGKKRFIPESNLYTFVNNVAVDHWDYLGLFGTGPGGKGYTIGPSSSGRVSFRGFSWEKLLEFRLINEDQTDGGPPNEGGATSGRVDGFWWKGIRTHWYEIPDFCWAIVVPEFSEDGFSVDWCWCCHACSRLLCELTTVVKDRPCTPGFVPNSGNTSIGKYPFED